MEKGFILSHRDMKTRCDKVDHPYYHRYGGRGIAYDPSWSDLKNFAADMLESWFPHASLDRIDNDKGYYKENCQWIERKEQTRTGKQGIRADNTSGHKGVERFRGGYRVVVRLPGYARGEAPKKTLYKGPSIEEALRVRKGWEDSQKV